MKRVAAFAGVVVFAFAAIGWGSPSGRVLLNAGPLELSKPAAAPAAATTFNGKRLHLVQFVDPVQPEWYRALADTGVRIITYIPENSYLVYADAGSLASLRQLASSAPFIAGEGEYLDEYKIDPRLRGPGEDGKENPTSEVVALQLVNDAAANGLTRQIVESLRLDRIHSEFELPPYRNIITRLSRHSLRILAAQPDLISIQPLPIPRKLDERQDQILAGNLNGGVPNGPGYLNWLLGKGFTQSQFSSSGFVVDISDSGVDDATTSPNHFGLYVNGAVSGTSRLMYARLEGTPNVQSTIQGCDGHGTLNAHLVGGYNSLTGFPHADASGYRYGLGVAPFVRMGSSVIFDPINFTFPNFPNLQSRAYNDAARISTNSWGALNGAGYDVYAQTFDALVRDAQPAGSVFETPGNQEMVMIFSAGNAGPGSQSVNTPGTAKNVITVGAAENVQQFGGSDGCGLADSDADSANDIATYSSRGPTMDGRRKPELVAPGTHITGGVFQQLNPGPNGTADLCYDGGGVCGGISSPFYPPSQQFYTASSGTSHSTPAIAGAATLVRQYFLNQVQPAPSPAMTKAYLVNSARYLTGAGANDSLWSIQQGMGSADLGVAFDGVPRILRDQIPADTFTASGQSRTYTGTISNAAKPFRVTLAWTDAPGSTTGAAYRNDLNLSVTAGGTTYVGNVFSGRNSTTGGSADVRNNLESVFLPPGVTGDFAVTITGANINSDGVPNSGGPLDQDFALVVYNATEAALPVLAPGTAQVSSEGCLPVNQAIDPDERVTVQFSLRNLGVAPTTNLVATLEATGGVVAPGPPQTYGAVSPGDPAVSRPFEFTASGSCGGTIIATLRLQDGPTDLGLVRFVLTLGRTVASTIVTTNFAVISVPAEGAAAPYPSVIPIAGRTGTVTKVTVTLNAITHTFPDDLDILLVGPLGHAVMLMSDTGDAADVNGISLTFDDAAPFPLPDDSALVTGTYRPTNVGVDESLPPPAPGAPYGSQLSAFNGLNPNGNWRLYVFDDSEFDSGSLASGWSLSITTSDPSCCVTFALTSIAPSSGPAAGGTTVTINGSGFASGATVKFGTVAATSTTVNSSSQITAVTPSLPPGTLHDVVVTNPGGATVTMTNGFMADFLDVPQSHLFHDFVEAILRAAITAGCGGGNYCPDGPVTREQMAVFILRGKHGPAYLPPPATGTVFADVPIDRPTAPWIEEIYAEGITAGCAVDPPRYCPTNGITRAQVAVFLLLGEHGTGYVPPNPVGLFDDVPVTNPFARWVEQLYNEGITAGCGTDPLRYCPTAVSTRGQMAVFLTTTFDLPLSP